MSNIQVAAETYFTKGYASLDRFIAYAYQLEDVRATRPKQMLFIGVGDGLVVDLLRKNPELSVTTLDIDPALHPDVVGDVRSLPFEDGSFDLICIYEVLEHLPFQESEKALAELARVSRGFVAVSVPHRRTGLDIALKFPFIRTLLKRDILKLSLLVPVRFPGFAVSKQHYWEIDWWTMKLGRVRAAMRKHFTIVAERTPPLDHYHHFFMLRSLNADAKNRPL